AERGVDLPNGFDVVHECVLCESETDYTTPSAPPSVRCRRENPEPTSPVRGNGALAATQKIECHRLLFRKIAGMPLTPRDHMPKVAPFAAPPTGAAHCPGGGICATHV